MSKYSNAFIEAVKETFRLAAFGVVSVFITALTSQFASLPQDQTTIFLTLVLRAVDRFIHEEKSIKRNGLLPF